MEDKKEQKSENLIFDTRLIDQSKNDKIESDFTKSELIIFNVTEMPIRAFLKYPDGFIESWEIK